MPIQKARNAKNKAIQDELDRNKYDGKKMWKTIKRLTNPSVENVLPISFSGQKISRDIANKFNE